MKKKERPNYAVSKVLSDRVVELVYNREEEMTSFAVFDGQEIKYLETIAINGKAFEPYPANRNLISKQVVLLPQEAAEYIDDQKLIKDIREFIHSYLDISPVFEGIATYYVLFSWVYDSFNEVPYLRVSGDYGSGKSRFLKVIGSICYKPMITSGATTVSPVFRTIDSFQGTLVLDEADFRFSDTTAEIVKILNSGYQKGNAVLRSEGKDGNYDIQSFDVFCPKIIATRKKFDDIALESRCLTEELEKKTLRSDIPINIPTAFESQALDLRNRLLMWRFRNLRKVSIKAEEVDKSIEPRLAQIITPLLSIIDDQSVKADISKMVSEYNQDFIAERNMSFEAEVLGAIIQCFEDNVIEPRIQEIAAKYNNERSERDKLTPRRVGSIIRRQFKLKPKRTNQGYVISETENKDRLATLRRRYGYEDDTSISSVNDVHEVNVVEQGTVVNHTELPF